jgi:hypothetical protein
MANGVIHRHWCYRDSAERWSSHQYGAGGELCLELGPDNWHQDLTGANMIESARRLLEGEASSPDQHGIVPSRHATTLGQDLRSRRLRLLVTPALSEWVDLSIPKPRRCA